MSAPKKVNTAPPTALPAPAFSPELLANLAKCDPYAIECLADWGGPTYLNPIIGNTPTETFSNLNDGLGFLHALLRSDDGMNCETYPGLALLVQTMWVAAQYEEHRQNDENGRGIGYRDSPD